ncbi:MAG: glycosyltransferase [Candidatus Krumholzibacteriaceae bacterium]|jgi:glycosyltransferase involved in cell wall biosynthesis
MVSREQSPRVEILASTLVMGGAERVIGALARGLPRLGLPVRVFCLYGPGEVGAEIASSGASLIPGLARFRHDPCACFRLARAWRNGGDAVLLTLDHHDAVFAGAIAARLAGVRHRLLAVHSTGLWGKAGSFSWSDRVVLDSYERVVALARAHADYLVERERVKRERVSIIPNGVDTEVFQPARSAGERDRFRAELSIPSGRFAVAMVAALRPEKNHGMLLDAAARIAERRGDFLFLIVGEGTEAEKLHRRARDLSLGDSVRFLGRRNDVSRILAASDASALCSWPVVETFPLVVLESMACRVPVVATDVGAVREMLVDREEGFIVPPGDVSAFAEALMGLARQPEMRRETGLKARERVVREFGIDNMINRYAVLIREVVKQ